MPLPLLLRVLATQESTTTTEVRRIVGDPLPRWVLLAVVVGVLAFIIIGGLVVNRRTARKG